MIFQAMKSTLFIHSFLIKIGIIMCLIVFPKVGFSQKEMSKYKLFFGEGTYQNQKQIILRSYEIKEKQFYIIVNPRTLMVQSVASSSFLATPLAWKTILEQFKDTPYIMAIEAAKKESFSLADSGITHGYAKENGVTLTIDLCPSHKALDRILFTSLIEEFKKVEKPVPIGISITGRFLLSHTEDIKWLDHLEKKGYIHITWINHTYNHRYNPSLPLTRNFLLEPNTDLSFELLGTEMALLQDGKIFSPFFRFPGLISSPDLVEKVTSFGLIPIGSDAWLAKGQPIHAGSIVLIHGNGNEPVGVKDFIQLLHNKDTSVMKKEWLLYDLRESVENEFHE